MSIFNTATGGEMNLKNPTSQMISIEDIAASLSKLCRFGGHSSQFYSVAQHSLIVYKLAPRELKIPALLHDAPEAYLGDVITPLKKMIGKPYMDLEHKFENVICDRFAVDHHLLAQVKPFDQLAFEIEFAYLQKGDAHAWVKAMKQLDLPTEIMLPYEAERRFLNVFNYELPFHKNPPPQCDLGSPTECADCKDTCTVWPASHYKQSDENFGRYLCNTCAKKRYPNSQFQ